MENKNEIVKICLTHCGFLGHVSQTNWIVDKQEKQIIAKNRSSFPNDLFGNFISTYSIEGYNFEEIFNQIEEATKDWKSEYVNFHIIDGGSWDLFIHYKNGEVKHYSGCNAEPSNYKEMNDLFFKMIDQNKIEQNKLQTEPPCWG